MATTAAAAAAVRVMAVSRGAQRVATSGSSVRTFVSRTLPKKGGDGHEHYVFETQKNGPFSKTAAGLVTWGSLILGTGIVVFAAKFQNKKHGFSS